MVVETESLVSERSAPRLTRRSAVFCCLGVHRASPGNLLAPFLEWEVREVEEERILEEKMTLSIASTKAVEYTQLTVYRIVDKYG